MGRRGMGRELVETEHEYQSNITHVAGVVGDMAVRAGLVSTSLEAIVALDCSFREQSP